MMKYDKKLLKKEYDNMLKDQGGKCMICGENPPPKKRLVVDHDHSTGKIRGLLCNSCNWGLGNFQDSVNIMKKAIKYLNTPLDRPKAIAIDLDDVCLNFLPNLIRVHKNITGEMYKIEDLTEWQLPRSLANTFKQYEECIYVSLKKKEGVLEAINRFRSKGYKIVFITARNESFRAATEFNLSMLKIPYDELFFNSRKAIKLRRLEELYSISAFIDDKLETILQVFEKTKIKNIFLVNMPNNMNKPVPDGIIRINHLNDINKIKED